MRSFLQILGLEPTQFWNSPDNGLPGNLVNTAVSLRRNEVDPYHGAKEPEQISTQTTYPSESSNDTLSRIKALEKRWKGSSKDAAESEVLGFLSSIDPNLAFEVAQDVRDLSSRFTEPCVSLVHERLLRRSRSLSCILLMCAWGDQHVISEECVICQELTDHYHGYRLPCYDMMCQECFCRSLEMAIKDESCYPPSCCGEHVDLDKILSFGKTDIEKEITKRYKEKEKQYSVAIRTWCATASCETLIIPHPVLRGQNVRCGQCGLSTCTVCKKARHIGEECPWDDAEVKLLAKAHDNGWKKCPRCSIWVERIEGCDNMR